MQSAESLERLSFACSCGVRSTASVFPVLCACGRWIDQDKAGKPAPRKVRSEDEIAELSRICIGCQWFREHARAGARCTHKACQTCNGKETGVPLKILHNVSFSPQLINLLTRRPGCPGKMW